jgi:hypothetical protein
VVAVPDEIRFAPDCTAFPLWAKDDRGIFDRNLERSVKETLPPGLYAALWSWGERWGQAENAEEEDGEDEATRRALAEEAATLVHRLQDELGGGVTVSSWFDAR